MALVPELSSLRLLAELSRLGSIGAAGRALGMSQQSASERLRTMEIQVGVVLVQRATSGSTLTSAGQLLVEWSRGLLEQADEVEAALAALGEDRSNELHVFASMTTAEYLLPRWLVRLRRERAVSATLHATNSETVVQAVHSGEADVGFVEGPGSRQGLASRQVGTDVLILVASPSDPWSRRRVPLDAVAVGERALTSRETGSGTRRVVEAAFEAAGGRPPRPEIELTTTAAVIAAVRAGGAPAFVSTRTVAREIESGQLVEVATSGLDLRRVFTAVWVGRQRPPAGPVRDLLAIAQRSLVDDDEHPAHS